MKLTQDEIFKLGFAYGSFSLDDFDQGVRIILPGTNHVNEVEENKVFEPLFTKYLDKISAERVLYNCTRGGVKRLYLNAVIKFIKDLELPIEVEEFEPGAFE